MFQYEVYQETAAYLREHIPSIPEVAVILGSGLGMLAEEMKESVRIPYTKIPNFPSSTVDSHKGELVYGQIGGKNVIVMSGRFHYYEGYTMEQVAFPIRVFSLLGVKTLVVTNAAGGVNQTYSPGDLMLITDHIKFFDESPARGPHLTAFGERFFDLTEAYSASLQKLAVQTAESLGMKLQQGVYFYMPGPQFETPAEIRALRILGADAVGMSTVPEVIAANQCGICVLGISCISNMAAGILPEPITDREVVEVAGRISKQFILLLTEIIRGL